ncbi:cytochrome c oxidase subunit 1 [Knufia obscura]|uniref:cAMP-dependent protein kinase n=2 Tax=Knufia TaxID=430999 RepID=A0AAN8EGX2_9EURO|nr:cytochrome c oxidase subunit 1 [Knufia obscura]KAK5953830.1 cytochrome c oxidase subunit 1 [Knufia fluminis]
MNNSTTLQPPRQQSQRALSAQGHRQSLRSSLAQQNSRSASNPHPTRQQSKDAIIKTAETRLKEQPPPAEDISSDPEQKGAGFSSKTLKFSDFELLQTLGTGTFARVWLCRFKQVKKPEDRKQVFALKVLKKVDVVKLKQVEHVRNERNVLAAVSGHPFITQMLASFSDSHSLYMLLEYTPGGEIFSYLRRARRFPFPTVQFYAAEITLILAYLHDIQHVAYRDLKPENILLDADGHLKLVDFGFAKYLPPDSNPPQQQPTPQAAPPNGQPKQPNGPQNPDSHSQPEPPQPPQHSAGVTYTLCGTPEYLAPEVIRNTGHGTAVDWWALGILVYEMLIGQPPFWDQNPMRIYEQIVQGHIRFPVPSSSSHPSRLSLHVPRVARDFILALCKTDPTERLGHIAGGSKRVMQHHFFEGVNWDDIYYRRRRGPILPRVEWEGDAGNFDEYPDPPEDVEESEGGRGRYTEEMRREWDAAFQDF